MQGRQRLHARIGVTRRQPRHHQDRGEMRDAGDHDHRHGPRKKTEGEIPRAFDAPLIAHAQRPRLIVGIMSASSVLAAALTTVS